MNAGHGSASKIGTIVEIKNGRIISQSLVVGCWNSDSARAFLHPARGDSSHTHQDSDGGDSCNETAEKEASLCLR